MIIDDNRVIIGSSNINDRSMLGYRDSEVNLLIEGHHDLKLSLIGGKDSLEVSEAIHRFRVQLFREHFGLEDDLLRDPTSEAFWRSAMNVLHFNTEFYEKVFNAYPTNRYHDWPSFLSSYQKSKEFFDAEAFKQLNKGVKGKAVFYPYQFLMNEKLKLAARNTALLVVPVRALF